MRRFGVVGILVVSFLALGAFYLNVGFKLVTDCIHVQPNLQGKNIIFFGKITRVEEQDDWFISYLSLCNSWLGNIYPLKIYTPRQYFVFSLGEEITFENSRGYHWLKKDVNQFKKTVTNLKAAIVRPEKLESTEQVLDKFTDTANFSCEQSTLCTSEKSFVNIYGKEQVAFLKKNESRQVVPVLLDIITGKAIVFSMDFGEVQSKDNFKILTEENLL
jgi:hypothetical protein